MGIENEDFVGNPHKQDYIDEDDDIYIDEVEIVPFALQPGDPDLSVVDDNYDIITDDDDDYDPEDDYEDFLSDTDFEYGSHDESDDSVSEEVNFSDSDQELSSGETEESSNKTNGDNKSVENKINGEVKTSEIEDISSNEIDSDS